MENHWQFEQDDEFRWRWTHTTEEKQQAQSSESFDRPADCILDAVRYAVRRRRRCDSAPE
jgi:hypothetical protein